MKKLINGIHVEMTEQEIAEEKAKFEQEEKERLANTPYDQLVSMFIREKYSQDSIEAIINNYLSNSEKYKAEFDELQAYRAECKARAKNLI